MKRLAISAIIVLGALAVTGVTLAAMAGSAVSGFQQAVLANLGSALLACSLAFFLVQMFLWARERNSGK